MCLGVLKHPQSFPAHQLQGGAFGFNSGDYELRMTYLHGIACLLTIERDPSVGLDLLSRHARAQRQLN